MGRCSVNVSGFLSCVEQTWVDLSNAVLNARDPQVMTRLRTVTQSDLTICRMATTHIGILINSAVSYLESNECYLNIGVWQGYSFFSGVVGNPEKLCIGNDNFSLFSGRTGFSGEPDALGRDFGDTRAIFYREYARVKSKQKAFFEGDYRDLLRDWHHRFGFQIGFYFYDGDHSYTAQIDALNMAAEYLSPHCVVLVDDTNIEDVVQANLDFLTHHRDFKLAFDLPTPANRFPTWWNGIQVLVREGEDAV